jgi:hypothetical protein
MVMQHGTLNPRAAARRLRELPCELPPPLTWDEFQSRSAARKAGLERARLARQLSARGYLALAASLAVVVAGVAAWSRLSSPVARTSVDDAAQELPMLAQPNPRFLAQAAASERWLSRLPAEPAVMRVGTRTAVANLEDRIAWMDDVLSAERLDAVDPSHIVALQHERARLVNSLAQVRYAESLVAAAH